MEQKLNTAHHITICDVFRLACALCFPKLWNILTQMVMHRNNHLVYKNNRFVTALFAVTSCTPLPWNAALELEWRLINRSIYSRM